MASSTCLEHALSSSSAIAADPLNLNIRKTPSETIDTLSKSRKSRKLASFYSDQNDQIDNFLTPTDSRQEGEEKRQQLLVIAIWGSLGANILLFAIHLYAALSTRSLSIFATLTDAFMDLISTVVLIIAGRLSKSQPSFDKYPTGKGKMETAGIIVFACLMATLSIQLVIEAVKTLIADHYVIKFDFLSYIAIGVAILTKFGLFLYCRALQQYPSAAVLAQDHRNDVVLNIVGLTLSLTGAKYLPWLDPAGGILIALLICRSWATTCFEKIQKIVGSAAPAEVISKLVYVSMTHDPRILEIDTVRAYHSGERFYVEVDIVLPELMSLREAHDIGEELQFKLEGMADVERAFVHLDYESEHRPEHWKEK